MLRALLRKPPVLGAVPTQRSSRGAAGRHSLLVALCWTASHHHTKMDHPFKRTRKHMRSHMGMHALVWSRLQRAHAHAHRHCSLGNNTLGITTKVCRDRAMAWPSLVQTYLAGPRRTVVISSRYISGSHPLYDIRIYIYMDCVMLLGLSSSCLHVCVG